ncbi:MAG: sugar phosphate nucleotidyltransferase [Bryobacteraceae bacterium]
MILQNRSNHCWAVVLAGGNGVRLLPLTHALTGDDRPKQFCALVGGRTLLQQTTRRIEKLIRPDQTLIAITRNHRQFVESQVPHLASSVVVQPENRGTGPAILYSLLSICRKDPNAQVAIFPSDHYFARDAVFMEYVRLAYEASLQRPGLVVLLGIVPNRPEPGYGWIEAAECLPGVIDGSLFRVGQFWEKPDPPIAEMLFARGCLWNSFVLVGSSGALLRLIREAAPDLYWRFETVRPALGTPEESDAVAEIYSRIPPVDFSGQILAARPDLLSVIPVCGAGFVDLGHPDRVLTALQHAASSRPYQRARLQNAASAVPTSPTTRTSFK